MSQSTNDSYPTAIKVAILLRNDKLIEELKMLSASFRTKGQAYLEIVKMGRTEMQDAVPMTVGQEFHAFAASLDGEIQELQDAEKSLYTVNMGATAIGTGINVPKGYPEKCAQTGGEPGQPVPCGVGGGAFQGVGSAGRGFWHSAAWRHGGRKRCERATWVVYQHLAGANCNWSG